MALKVNPIKQAFIALIALAIPGALIFAGQALSIPSWPLLFILTTWFFVNGGKPEALVPQAVGGLIGLGIGFAPAITATLIPGNAILPFAALIITALAFFYFATQPTAKYANLTSILFFLVLTSPSFAASAAFNMILPTLISYAIGVLLAGLINLVMTSLAKKKSVASVTE